MKDSFWRVRFLYNEIDKQRIESATSAEEIINGTSFKAFFEKINSNGNATITYGGDNFTYMTITDSSNPHGYSMVIDISPYCRSVYSITSIDEKGNYYVKDNRDSKKPPYEDPPVHMAYPIKRREFIFN